MALRLTGKNPRRRLLPAGGMSLDDADYDGLSIFRSCSNRKIQDWSRCSRRHANSRARNVSRLKRSRRGHDLAAVFAGAKFLVVVSALKDLET